MDRRLTLREILEKVFGLIPRFKSKDELLEEEFAKFVADYKPDEADAIPAIKTLLQGLRHQRPGARTSSTASTSPTWRPIRSSPSRDFKAVPEKYRTLVPEYIKDYVSLNQFAA